MKLRFVWVGKTRNASVKELIRQYLERVNKFGRVEVVELRDRTVILEPGELFVVPRGTEHRPCARNGEVKLLLIDPQDLPNTGDPATATIAIEI